MFEKGDATGAAIRDCGRAGNYLCLFISVVSQPAIGFSEVIKYMDPPLGGPGLQHNGGGRVHLRTDPTAVEHIENQHAEEEQGTNNADISGKLLLGVAKKVEGVEWRSLWRSLCGVPCTILQGTAKPVNNRPKGERT